MWSLVTVKCNCGIQLFHGTVKYCSSHTCHRYVVYNSWYYLVLANVPALLCRKVAIANHAMQTVAWLDSHNECIHLIYSLPCMYTLVSYTFCSYLYG